MSISKDTVVESTLYSPTSIFYYLLLPALVLGYIYWKASRWHMLKLAEKIPGPSGLPIVGNLFDFIGSSSEVFRRLIEASTEFTQLAKVWIGPKLVVFIFDPRDVEILLSSQVYIDKSPEYEFFKPWLGDGLLISTGQKWRSHRKLIAPTFHLSVLKNFIDLFNANSRDVVERLKKEGSKTFDAHDYMSEATVEILLETAMGVPKKIQNRSGYEYAMAVMKMCDILHLRHRNVFLRSNFLFSMTKWYKEQGKLLGIIHGLTTKVVKRKKDALINEYKDPLVVKPTETTIFEYKIKSSNKDTTSVEGLSFGQSAGLKDDLDNDMDNDIGEKKRLAFLDLLLESAQNGALISDIEIKEQVDTIMFEGHDTTAAASSFFLSLMGIHQNIQEKVYAELVQIFGDSDRPATFQDTLEMKYLERCLMETLRMFPPVPLIARQLQEDLKLASGDYVIPAGATVGVATFKLHRDPKTFPNPDQFNPDNFLPERQANRHYYAFVPFSAGPRSCVGRKYAMLKLKVLLSTIMRNFKIYSDVTEKDFKLQGDIILKREEGFNVRLAPRIKLPSNGNALGTQNSYATAVVA